jgi:hypothetical protein
MPSTSDVRERFKKLLDAITARQKAVGEAVKNNGPLLAFIPDKNEWSGNLLDIMGMAKPFDRNEHATDVQRAIADVNDPGVVGDLAASVMQADTLASAERAFRLRHMTKVRAMVHAGGRAAASAHDHGVWKKGVGGAVRDMVAQAKDIAE